MAKFRKVHTSFWDDPDMENYSPEDKYFYLFLLTNPISTECGIYPMTIKKMEFYTGYNRESIMAILRRFIDRGKVCFCTESSEVCIVNKPKYIDRLGKPVLDCIESELKKVKSKWLINKQLSSIENQEVRYVYDTCTISGQEEEKEEEKEEDGESEIFSLDAIKTKDLMEGKRESFERFWNEYDKKVGDREKIEKKWYRLSKEDERKIFDYIPKYKLTTPDKKYRKNPETFLNNKAWLDELILPNSIPQLKPRGLVL